MLKFEMGNLIHSAAKLQKVYLCRKIVCVMNDNLFIENLKQSIGMRIFLFLIILLISSLIGIALSFAFMSAGDTGMKIGQGISSIFMFVVPPIVYYFVTRKAHPMHDLGFRGINKPWPLFVIVAFALVFVSLPVTNQLSAWNENMKLGGALQALEDMLKALEETAAAATEQMLTVDTIGGLLLNLVVIALIPAIGEELTFRGVLQQSLTRKMNPHVAIILSSAIFSFIHFQFYGFLPRMFLGMLLGYVFYISNSLWPNILMHFLNNGCAVVVYYLNNKGFINVDVDHFGQTQSVWMILASAAVTIGLIAWSWKKGTIKETCQER